MKQKILAIFLFVIIISFVIINSLILTSLTDAMIINVEGLNLEETNSLEKASDINYTFTKMKNYIGLTVSHDDLTNIEDCLAELGGCLEIGDTDGATITKHRLISFLGHLRRLVGFNIDTII